MQQKPIGSFDCLPGMKDGHKFYIWTLKEPSYVSMLMGTFGSMLKSSEKSANVVRVIQDEKDDEQKKLVSQ